MTIVDRIGNVPDGLPYKAPVACASMANLTLSGLQIVDGIALLPGQRVLAWKQTDRTQNNIYQAQTGSWAIPNDANNAESWIEGTQVYVTGGLANAGKTLALTTPDDPVVIGASELVFALAGPAASGATTTPTPTALNPLDYGVFGDGVTNDSTAINAFLTLCRTRGAKARFPGLTYALGGNSILVPDYSDVEADAAAVFLRSSDPPAGFHGSYTDCMISMGNHCRWSGGTLQNTTVVAQSTTPGTLAVGSIVLTVPAGLNINPGDYFAYVYSRSAPTNNFQGTVTNYVGTQLTINAAFVSGSGTFSDWNLNTGTGFQCPLVMHNVTESIAENIRVIGTWYVGPQMEAFNPPSGGSLVTSYCTFRNLWIEGAQNRGIYCYGSTDSCLIEGCFIQGAGITNYGVNVNAGNASGIANSTQRLKVEGCAAVRTSGHGFGIGDRAFYCAIADCSAAATGDVGFVIEFANTGTPVNCSITGCVATNVAVGYDLLGVSYVSINDSDAIVCGIGYSLAPGGGSDASFCSINGCGAESGTDGFHAWPNSNRCDLNNIRAVSNSGFGVRIDAGCSVTIASGRSRANGTNLLDAGTGTVSTNLVTA